MLGIENDDWKRDCLHWRGRVLVGERSHWCLNWDNLPIDETCLEWPCGCQRVPSAKPVDGGADG